MSILTPVRAAIAAVAMILVAGVASAAEEHNLTDAGYAANGYDPVAYFTDNKAVEGVDDYTADHDGVTYRFSSAANRDAFSADPARYAPQYGGFCAFGLAMGRKVPTDPNAFSVVDGKLYLNLNKQVQERWSGDIPGFIKGADNNWSIVESIPEAELAKGPPQGVTLGAQ